MGFRGKVRHYGSALNQKLSPRRGVVDPPVPTTALVPGRIFKTEASLPMPSKKLKGTVGAPAAFDEVALTTIGRMSMAGIKPEDDVLDIGCGVGRTARYLCDLLGPGATYEGFDILEDGIVWCQENITPVFPNFRFSWTPVSHSHYRPDPSLPKATELKFPYPDESFDFAFAHSVFTHLLPDVTQHYFDQIARVLRPGGILYATWFLFDVGPSTWTHPLATEMQADPSGAFAVLNPTVPELAVAYSEPFVRSALANAGLTVTEPIHSGIALLQDVIVARK
jgi:SAM-dependent methyltransferase